MFCHLTEFLTPLALASYHIAAEKFTVLPYVPSREQTKNDRQPPRRLRKQPARPNGRDTRRPRPRQTVDSRASMSSIDQDGGKRRSGILVEQCKFCRCGVFLDIR